MIRVTTIPEFFDHPDTPALLAEYAEESSIAGLPAPMPHRDTYELLEASGRLTLYTAEVNGRLVGFLLLLTSINPHYGAQLSVVESYFVASHARAAGAGLALLHQAEARARVNGSAGLLLSAPLDSQLDKVLTRMDSYRATNRVYFKPTPCTH